jgi:hypothetical protein
MQEVFVDLADAGRTAALNINNWTKKFKPLVFPVALG